MPTYTYSEAGGSFEPHRSGMTVIADEAFSYNDETGQHDYGDQSFNYYQQGNDWEDPAYSDETREHRFDGHPVLDGDQETTLRYWLSPGQIPADEMAYLIGQYEEGYAAGYMSGDDIDRIGHLFAFKNGELSLQDIAYVNPELYQILASGIQQMSGYYQESRGDEYSGYEEDDEEDDDDGEEYSESGAFYADIIENVQNQYGEDFYAAQQWFAGEFGPGAVEEFNRIIDVGATHEIQELIGELMQTYYAGDRNTYDY